MNHQIATSVARNTTVQLAQQLATWASTFVLMLFLPRYLGPANYGKLFLAMSVAGLFVILIDFDGRIGVAKRISRFKEDSPGIVSNSLALRGMFWLATFGAMMAFSVVAGYAPLEQKLLVIFGIEMLWLGGRSVLLGFFIGHEVVIYTAIGAILERVFISIVGIIALLMGVGVTGIAIVMILGTFLNFAYLLRHARVFIPSFPRVNWKATREMAKQGVPFLL